MIISYQKLLQMLGGCYIDEDKDAIVEFLLDHGVNTSLSNGMLPLTLLIITTLNHPGYEQAYYYILRTLLEHGAEITQDEIDQLLDKFQEGYTSIVSQKLGTYWGAMYMSKKKLEPFVERWETLAEFLFSYLDQNEMQTLVIPQIDEMRRIKVRESFLQRLVQSDHRSPSNSRRKSRRVSRKSRRTISSSRKSRRVSRKSRRAISSSRKSRRVSRKSRRAISSSRKSRRISRKSRRAISSSRKSRRVSRKSRRAISSSRKSRRVSHKSGK